MPFGRLKDLFSTLRFRLVMWVTLVVLVMVVVTMVTVREVVHRALLYEFDHLLVEEATGVALAIEQFYPTEQKQLVEALQTKVDVLARREWFREWFIELFGADGMPLWSSNNVPPNLPAPARNGDRAPLVNVDGYRVIEARVTAHNGQVLFARCGCSRRPVEEDLELVDWIMVWTGSVTLLLAPLGGYALAGRATRPIAKIIATAASLQPSKLDERLPIRGTGDELDQLSRTINGMLDRIAEYIERNRDFVANAAHELRSPLAAIRTTVEVALNRVRTPEEYASLLTDVMEECSRLAGLVNQLLLLAEGDAGRLVARDQSVQLDKVVREAIDMFDGVAEIQGVVLQAGELPAVVVPGDETHLRQVVRNLIDNAIKFTPAPGQVHVSLGVDAGQRRAWLRVRDSGQGIALEDVPRIFERFYRGDKARTRELRPGGHGLGLSICQSIIAALGGTIAVESQPGRGSTFTVWLPLLGAAQAPGGAEAPPAAGRE
jgi:two-component system, OmpR family, heavy metal sensor histidine kinase CusS